MPDGPRQRAVPGRRGAAGAARPRGWRVRQAAPRGGAARGVAAPAVVAIIPARWGAVRFPGKPLHPLGGRPLIQHVWERCREAGGVADVMIATDDRRIAVAAAAFGARAIMTSPKHRSGSDRIAEVLRRFPEIGHVVNVQGDEPLIDPRLIDRLARAVVAGEADVVTAATPFRAGESVANPNAVKVVLGRDGNALYFSRSPIPFVRDGTAPVAPLRHLGVYAYRREFLLRYVRWRPTPLEEAEKLEQLRALERGAAIRVLVVDGAAPGVDTPADAEVVERLLAARRGGVGAGAGAGRGPRGGARRRGAAPPPAGGARKGMLWP